MRIDRLRVDDASEVADVFERSRAAAMPWLPVLHTPEEDVAFFAGQLASSAGWGAWASTEGEAGADRPLEHLVGFAVTSPGWLDHLYVAPGERGRGIGSRLLSRALEDQSGPVRLWAFQRNLPALAFYAERGFDEVERTDGTGNEEREPDVLMCRPADSPTGSADRS